MKDGKIKENLSGLLPVIKQWLEENGVEIPVEKELRFEVVVPPKGDHREIQLKEASFTNRKIELEEKEPTEDDWNVIAAFPLSPKQRLIINILRERNNQPVSAQELFDAYKKKFGYQVVSNINTMFKHGGLKWKLGDVQAGWISGDGRVKLFAIK